MDQFLASVDTALGSAGGQLGILALALVALVVGLVLLVNNGRQRRRLAILFSKAEDASFYEHVDAMTRAFAQQTATQAQLTASFNALEQTSHGFFDTVDIEHYDAFPGQAGKFSFSLLMLNRNGSGIVLTSLTSTQGSKMYVKRIENGKSDTAMSHEEQDLLSRHIRS
ncbi:MAG: hypothetical protein C0398_08220 [Coprothermobacter sp.]|nr:hypothetical protein [Coprothermobacter sp.]